MSALSRANGSVLLYVQAPGSGRAARGRAERGRDPSARRRAHRAQGAPASAARALERGHVATRTVATRAMDPKGAGLSTLTLALAARYRALAGERGGLSATVNVTFCAPGHATLRERLPVTFLRKHAAARSKVRSHKASTPARPRRVAGR